MWMLESRDTASPRATFRIFAGSIKTIGRSPGAEFIIEDALVSRVHCRLTATVDALEVKDLDSTNGTFVNGERVQTVELHDGDTLTVGRVDLLVSRKTN